MDNSPTLALIREDRQIKRHFPQGQATLKMGVLRWTGDLQPSEISRQYSVHLHYTPPKSPRVFVRNPKLAVDADGNLPHIYPDGSLCLHEPGQWVAGEPIAEIILRWTCEWLLHYEFWKATGEWYGSGGNHTGPIKARSTTRQSRFRRRSKTHTPVVRIRG